jgi:hypothetical protein
MFNEARSTTMQTWEYLFVFAAITSEGGEFRPRFANDQELDEWQKGPTMYDYANQLGASGWGVNNGCKILNNARIKLPSAGRAVPTGKK